ncbi:ParA family protein [Helicobacter ganmani]|uniref:Chromosome partitioning protein ParA n=1 Tax=Helicobacter ganmani TaxID=60246 RepID=A0A3D8IHE4_9HELI|nr:ParA family protein [Helicobacter ganmani]RDU64553.1 chromosome partitioning protein ParA [Helicobacter ganmani]
MVFSICNEKGGSGKTTFAINLATKLNEQGKCLVIDLDPQKSISAFLSFREEKKMPFDFKNSHSGELQELIKQAKKSYQNIVIDTGGRDSTEMRGAMIYSDICIIPTIPNGLDVVVLSKMLDYLKEAEKINRNLKGVVAITKATTNPFLQYKIGEFQDFIKSKNENDFFLLKNIIFEREALKEAILQGKGIVEAGIKNSKRAKEDFLKVFKELMEVTNE